MKAHRAIARYRTITAIAVDCWDMIGIEGELHSEAAISWERGGRRYHVWIDPLSGQRVKDALLCDPAAGVVAGGEGFFWTRHLDPDNGANRGLVAAVIRYAIDAGLVRDAYMKWASERTRYLRKHRRAVLRRMGAKAASRA